MHSDLSEIFIKPREKGHGRVRHKKGVSFLPPSGDGIGTFLCVLVSRREGSNLLLVFGPHAMLTTLGKVSCSLDMGSTFSGGHSYPLGYRNVIMDSPYSKEFEETQGKSHGLPTWDT